MCVCVCLCVCVCIIYIYSQNFSEGKRTGLTAVTEAMLFSSHFFFISCQGGRTGLTAVTAAMLFFLSLFFAPLFGAVPTEGVQLN